MGGRGGGGGLAALAGLSLHAQLGFTDPVLGGTPTSAAYYFAVAVVASFVGYSSRQGQRGGGVSPP